MKTSTSISLDINNALYLFYSALYVKMNVPLIIVEEIDFLFVLKREKNWFSHLSVRKFATKVAVIGSNI